MLPVPSAVSFEVRACWVDPGRTWLPPSARSFTGRSAPPRAPDGSVVFVPSTASGLVASPRPGRSPGRGERSLRGGERPVWSFTGSGGDALPASGRPGSPEAARGPSLGLPPAPGVPPFWGPGGPPPPLPPPIRSPAGRTGVAGVSLPGVGGPCGCDDLLGGVAPSPAPFGLSTTAGRLPKPGPASEAEPDPGAPVGDRVPLAPDSVLAAPAWVSAWLVWPVLVPAVFFADATADTAVKPPGSPPSGDVCELGVACRARGPGG